jgi:Kef-type K+ transport system membrane component KefB
VFASLFVLMWLGDRANPQAVLPAFVLGLALSSHYAAHQRQQQRLRIVAFAFLTPFFLLKGGMSVSLSALWANLGVLVLLFLAKLLPKFAAVYPVARRTFAPHGVFATLLMSTGLTSLRTMTARMGPMRNPTGSGQSSPTAAVAHR